MTSQQGNQGREATDAMRAGAQMWEAGYRSLMEGWRQSQEFWSNMARGMGQAGEAWMGQMNRAGQGASRESMDVLRELQEAALAVAQAWMRLPLALMGGAQPGELQDAFSRLAQAQGHAYQLWLEALGQAGGAAAGATGATANATTQTAQNATRGSTSGTSSNRPSG